MKKPTIISIVGARPQFIKHAPVQLELQKHFSALTIHTGQHYDENMSQVFFNELGISKPDFVFDQRSYDRQGAQTGHMLTEIEEVLLTEKPDLILVYGDTNSTLAATLAAVKLSFPVVHIEAGLRSFNRHMPEEINRIVADQFSEMLFCPSDQAVENLRNEGIASSKIFRSGDVMCDMLRLVEPNLKKPQPNPYYFATIHRPYNTDDPNRLKTILRSFQSLSHEVVLALHPRTKSRLNSFGIDHKVYTNIKFIEPQSYLDSISYQNFSEAIITDSGGIQKEAYMLKKKCITVRRETEWIETLDNGWNQLIFDDLIQLETFISQTPGQHFPNLYGDGKAAKFIVNNILKFFFGNSQSVEVR